MREKTMKIQLMCVGLALVLGACAAAETAGQITFGETDWTGDGQTVLPKLATVLPWPNIDDLLEVETEMAEAGGARFVLKQTLKRDGETLCRADVTAVLLNAQGRPVRLPPALRGLLGAR